MNYTNDQICLLVDKFKNKTLLKENWTHQAHLTVAVWYVKNYEFYDAICRIKSGIMNLNTVHNTENTGNSGYHETLTIFWMKIVELFVKSNINYNTEQLVNKFLKSTLSNKDLPFKFYTKELLLSVSPRSLYFEPILRKIDESVIEDI